MVTGEMIRSKGEKTTQSSKAWKTRYFLIYSLLFVGMALLVFWPYIENHKSFVWSYDGVHQHFRAMVLYSRWLKTIAQNLFVNHVFEIPAFSFSLGYGSDIVTTLNYYMIGDPLTVFSGFVPETHLQYFYSFLTVFRLYLSGIVFSVFCFYRDKRNTIAILCGSIVYVFSGYNLFALRHPFFLNAMIYLPLVLLGVEMIIREKKTRLLTIAVFVCAISNFYFFYMIVCFTVIYVGVRILLLCVWKQQRYAFASLFRIAYSSVLGVLLSAFLLLPVMISFFADGRMGTESIVPLFYGKGYYNEMIKGLVSFNNPDAYCIFGYSALLLVMIFLLYRCGKSREHRFLKVLLPVLVSVLVFPAFGYAMNGFSYLSFRFVFGYSLLAAYIVVAMWDAYIDVSKKVILQCLLVLASYIVLCMALDIWINNNMYTSLLVSAFILVLFFINPKRIKSEEWKRIKSFALLAGLLCSVYVNANQCNSTRAFGYPNSFLRVEDVEGKLYTDESVEIGKLDEKGSFSRYSGTSITRNATVMTGTSSTQYYWSLSNPNVVQFHKEVGNLDNEAMFSFSALDDRTILNALTGVKYYVNRSGQNTGNLPMGYALLDSTNEKYDIYENSNPLPFGYTYSAYMDKSDFELLNPLEKEECMLHAVVTEEAFEKNSIAQYPSDLQTIPFRTQPSENVVCLDDGFVVLKENALVELIFEGVKESETYLLFEGLQYGYFDENGIFFARPKHGEDVITLNVSAFDEEGSEEASCSKNLSLTTIYNKNNTERTDFAVNLSYSGGARKKIVIAFPKEGVYRFEKMSVVCNSLEHYEDAIQNRKSDTLEQLDLHNDNFAYATRKVTGVIKLSENKALVVNIPFSSGWTAYVDGKKQKPYRANLMFTGLDLEKGIHEVTFVYRTPGALLGFSISSIALVVWMVIETRKRKAWGGKNR